MDDTPPVAANDAVKREAQTLLATLFAGAKPLVEGNSEHCPSERTLRPALAHGDAPKGRSPFMVSKLSYRGGESYNIKTSGIQAWKMFAIIDAMSAMVTMEPHIVATDEMGGTIDANDVNKRRNIAHLKVDYPNKTSMYWTSVSGINIHCPTREIFNTLARGFTPREQTIAG